MHSKFNFREVILPTIYEYVLIVIPIAIYVTLEAAHKDVKHFIKSPEWAIASIFLCFQAIALYYKHMAGSPRRINIEFLGFLLLFIVVITVASAINAYVSLEEIENTKGKVLLRLVLLTISSTCFFVLVLASKIKK